MSKNNNYTKGNNNNIIQEVTNSDIHIGDNIYNNPEQYKAHIADLQTNLREKGQFIEDLRLVVAELRTDKQHWQQKSIELEKQYQNETISENEYLAQKEALAKQVQAKDELIAAKDEERNELITENLRQSTEINALQTRLDIAEKALAELQEKYKDIDFSKQTETYKKAYDFILVGNVQAADELLSEAYFAEREAKIAEQNKETYRSLAQEYVLKGETLTTNFKWEEAEGYYKKAIEKCPDAEFWFEYAYFLGKLRRINQAIECYEKALAQRRAEKDETKIAKTLNNLAVLYTANQEIFLAGEKYRETLSIYRKLARENTIDYLHNVADTLNNFANSQYTNGEFSLAGINYQEALEIKRKLVKENPTVYLPSLASTLNNLANLQKNNNEFAAAHANYQEALEVRRKLAAEKPIIYLPDLAMTLNNLAILQHTNQQFTLSYANYQEALGIRRKLAKENPAAYLPALASVLNNLANLQKINNEFVASHANYQEALIIRRKLAQESPSAYLPDVAATLNNLGLKRVNIKGT